MSGRILPRPFALDDLLEVAHCRSDGDLARKMGLDHCVVNRQRQKGAMLTVNTACVWADLLRINPAEIWVNYCEVILAAA